MRRRMYVQISTPKLRPRGIIDNYEYVDLGLPSGILWAKCNFGATKETDYGMYRTWGLSCMWSKWSNPSRANFNELISNTFNEFTTVNGVKGVKFRNKKDSNLYIFIPAAGFLHSDGNYYNIQTQACVWTTDEISSRSGYNFSGDDSSIKVSNAWKTFSMPYRYVHRKP